MNVIGFSFLMKEQKSTKIKSFLLVKQMRRRCSGIFEDFRTTSCELNAEPLLLQTVNTNILDYEFANKCTRSDS